MIRHVASVAASLAPGLWAGLILGAGFIAVPAVFQAGPDVAKPFAYAATANVFARLSAAEWIFALILALSLAGIGFPRRRTIAVVMLVALMAAQEIWLRPELMARAEVLAAGGTVEPSAAHAIYAALELCKLAWLAGLAYAGRNG